MTVSALILANEGIWSRIARRLSAVRPILAALAVIGVLVLAWTAVGHLADEVSYADLKAALAGTPGWAVAAALGLTGVSFAALTIYDLGALAFVGRRLPGPVVALASFCAYAVGNTVGFGPLTAGAIRYRFYTPHGVEPDEVARIVGFVTAAFGLGLAGIAGIGMVLAAADIPQLPMPVWAAQAAGAAVVVVLAGVWLGGGGRDVRVFSRVLRLPSRTILMRQFLATAVDVAASAAVLWVLLPGDVIGLPAFIAIYAVAVGLGVLSHVPAGLGVFETIIIAALSPRLDVDNVLSALVLYRVIYHLVPLALAAVTVAAMEIRRAAAIPLVAAGLQAGGRMAPPVLGALTFVAGAVLIFSGVTPIGDASLDYLGTHLPLPLVESAHFIGSVLGVVLLVVARGLVYRLDGAWWAAMVIVPLSILLSLVKAVALGEAVLLAVLLLSLAASRREFLRRASLLHQALTANWIMAVVTLLLTALALLLFVYKDVDYANELWWQFELSEHAPRSLRALLGMALTAGFGAAWMLLRPVTEPLSPPDGETLARAAAIVAAQPHVDANLVAMGDKHLLFSDDGRAFIMFGRHGRSWVALADPVGPRECWSGLIWHFVEKARAAGGRAAFYQVAPDALAFYADAGLRAFKLGEEARVRLSGFDTKGPKRANLRHALNRAERDGLDFTILPVSDVPDHMDELAQVSRAWMAHHNVREKRFSLGAFDPAYVRAQPVAVLRREGRIIAFATLMLTNLKEEASIDLMRFLPDAPNGVMEVLLLKLILHFQAEGYGWFTLGMAPLSGLSDSEAAPMWHLVGRAVFDHGEWFYNFSGLRTFKAKFLPEWQPRYLAVAGGINPMLALADVTVLISGGLKGVIGK